MKTPYNGALLTPAFLTEIYRGAEPENSVTADGDRQITALLNARENGAVTVLLDGQRYTLHVESPITFRLRPDVTGINESFGLCWGFLALNHAITQGEIRFA